MIKFFSKRTEKIPLSSLATDMHSHLLPGLDDGVKSIEEAEQIIRHFYKMGFRKIITTPHVMSDYFKNTPDTILSAFHSVEDHLKSNNIPVEFHAAAEYYLDESLMDTLNGNKKLLTLSGNYLLFETNFITEPLMLREFIFAAKTRGFQPVLAHPERYLYIQSDLKKAEDLINRGVLFQMNIGSILGQYDRVVQQTARKLIHYKWVHLLGSDCHNLKQIEEIDRLQADKYLQKALSLPLLNAQL